MPEVGQRAILTLLHDLYLLVACPKRIQELHGIASELSLVAGFPAHRRLSFRLGLGLAHSMNKVYAIVVVIVVVGATD